MEDNVKTKAHLIAVLEELRERLAEFEALETKYKRNEEALREIEKRCKRITETVTDYIFTVRIEDGQPVETIHSPSSVVVTGYTPEEFASDLDLWIRIVHDEDKAAVMEQASRILSGQDVDPLEYRIMHKGGDIRWIRNTLIPYNDSQGKLLSYDGLIRDITERKKAEEETKKARDDYIAITNLTGDIIIHVDKEGKHTFLNDGACEFWGKSREELMGNSFFDYFHPDDQEKTMTVFQEMIESKKILKGHVNRQKTPKGWRTVEWNAVPIFDNSRNYRGIQAIGKDITDHKRVEKELKLAQKFTKNLIDSSLDTIISVDENAITVHDSNGKYKGSGSVIRDLTERIQLEEERMKTEKLESIGVLAGGIAHDFNNLLTVILGNIFLAKKCIDIESEEFGLLTNAENVGFQAKDLTRQLLTFSKGGAPIKETAELIELIEDTASFSLRGSKVGYSTSFTPDLWVAEVDKGQINQAVSNLIINAQQAMPEGGIIHITGENVTVTSEDNLPIQEGKYVKISLKDKGIGISDEHYLKIFDPYFTTKPKGSGLGLTTTYSIIKKHDGHITFESEIGVGTTFHIFLPASTRQVEEKKAIKEDTGVMTGKILIMDDDQGVRNTVSSLLKYLGNEVDVANDGSEVIELYVKAMNSGKPFDIVIMDLTIPGGMGGKETIEKLLEIDPDAKAIVSSGYADDSVLSNYKVFGFKGNLSKPFKPDELKEVITRVMTGKKN